MEIEAHNEHFLKPGFLEPPIEIIHLTISELFCVMPKNRTPILLLRKKANEYSKMLNQRPEVFKIFMEEFGKAVNNEIRNAFDLIVLEPNDQKIISFMVSLKNLFILMAVTMTGINRMYYLINEKEGIETVVQKIINVALIEKRVMPIFEVFSKNKLKEVFELLSGRSQSSSGQDTKGFGNVIDVLGQIVEFFLLISKQEDIEHEFIDQIIEHFNRQERGQSSYFVDKHLRMNQLIGELQSIVNCWGIQKEPFLVNLERAFVKSVEAEIMESFFQMFVRRELNEMNFVLTYLTPELRNELIPRLFVSYEKMIEEAKSLGQFVDFYKRLREIEPLLNKFFTEQVKDLSDQSTIKTILKGNVCTPRSFLEEALKPNPNPILKDLFELIPHKEPYFQEAFNQYYLYYVIGSPLPTELEGLVREWKRMYPHEEGTKVFSHLSHSTIDLPNAEVRNNTRCIDKSRWVELSTPPLPTPVRNIPEVKETLESVKFAEVNKKTFDLKEEYTMVELESFREDLSPITLCVSLEQLAVLTELAKTNSSAAALAAITGLSKPRLDRVLKSLDKIKCIKIDKGLVWLDPIPTSVASPINLFKELINFEKRTDETAQEEEAKEPVSEKAIKARLVYETKRAKKISLSALTEVVSKGLAISLEETSKVLNDLLTENLIKRSAESPEIVEFE